MGKNRTITACRVAATGKTSPWGGILASGHAKMAFSGVATAKDFWLGQKEGAKAQAGLIFRDCRAAGVGRRANYALSSHFCP